MGYIDQLRPATFRGVTFYFSDDETSFGRRVVTHQFPDIDDPYHEDLGKDVRTFSVEAIICGDSFLADARSFEAALEKPGAGLLVHPWYGEVSVVVKTVRRRHSLSSVGEIPFSITFERDKTVIYPTAAADTAAGVSTAADNVHAALGSDFAKNYSSAVPDFVTTDGVSRISTYMTRLNGLLKQNGLMGYFPGLFPNESSWSVNSSDDLVAQIKGLFQTISDMTAPAAQPAIATNNPVTSSPAPAVTVMKTMAAASTISVADDSTAATPEQSTRINNAQSLDLHLRGSAIAAASAAAANADYESREQAVAVRKTMSDSILTLSDDLRTAGWDESASAMVDAMAALSRDINDRIGRLPRTATFRPPGVVPSLVVSNRLYGGDPAVIISRAADLVSRNAVRHPGFMPLADLEVLIDV